MMFTLVFQVTDFYFLIINELRTLIRFLFCYRKQRKYHNEFPLIYPFTITTYENQESEMEQCKYEYGKHNKYHLNFSRTHVE